MNDKKNNKTDDPKPAPCDPPQPRRRRRVWIHEITGVVRFTDPRDGSVEYIEVVETSAMEKFADKVPGDDNEWMAGYVAGVFYEFNQ